MAFKRVWRAKRTFKTLGERLSDRKRNKLEKKYTEQGIFDFRSQTAHVRSPHWTSPHIIFADAITYLVWESVSLGKSLPRAPPFLAILTWRCHQRLDDQFIFKRIVQVPSSPALQTGDLEARFSIVDSILGIIHQVRSILSAVCLRVMQWSKLVL